ncbi:hypothetical protein BDZ91DRAFT_785524 [Kalaharituber pfeilii]|nr:hypothetical protein BDZ91DRAFT_785524 [Kalaharituber pfeilii]
MPPPVPFEPLPDEPWDVLIAGTGLKQSLLACALSRANKKVLQVDANTFYGSSETCFSHLREAEEWISLVSRHGFSPYAIPNSSLDSNTTATTTSLSSRRACPLPFSHAKTWSKPGFLPPEKGYAAGRGYILTLSPTVMYWFDPLLNLLREVDMTGQFLWQAVGAWWVLEEENWVQEEAREEEEMLKERGMAGAVGDAVTGVGVRIARAGMKKGGWNKGRKRDTAASTGDASTAAATATGPGESSTPLQDSSSSSPLQPQPSSTSTTSLRTIPPTPSTNFILKETACTFEDIAWDPTLTNTHRTTLASFLRYIQSYQVSDSTSVTTLHTLLTTTFPLPPRLRAHIHALTLLPTPPHSTPCSIAIPRLKRHLASLGRIPDARSAAGLFVGYGGSAEMCQVFSRGGAVAGAVNVLGRGVVRVHCPPFPSSEVQKRKWEVELESGEVVRVPWVVGGEWDLPDPNFNQSSPSPLSTAMARGVYIINHPLPALFNPKYPDERISPGGCIAAVFSPATLTNLSETADSSPNPVYLHPRASSQGECPMGKSLIYASQLLPPPSGVADAPAWDGAVETGYRALDDAVGRVLGRLGVEGEGEEGVVYKLLYTQYASSGHDGKGQPVPEGLEVLRDLELDMTFPLVDADVGKVGVVEEVVGVYGRILESDGDGDGDGDVEERRRKIKEGFMQVSEDVRRLMREGREEEM